MPDPFNGSAEARLAYEALRRAILAAPPPERESLAALAARHGTDKAGNCVHYETYLQDLRDQPVTLLEIGIGGGPVPSSGGGSLRTWRDYFPQGRVIGVDVADKSPHAEGRVQVFQGSQDDPAFLRLVAEQAGPLDVVVDDGSHVSAHITLPSENSLMSSTAGRRSGSTRLRSVRSPWTRSRTPTWRRLPSTFPAYVPSPLRPGRRNMVFTCGGRSLPGA